jgi:tryptophanyl-tRNA synthetase
MWHETTVQFPDKYVFSNYTELIEKFASANTPYDILGVIIKNNETGERTKFRNPIYEEVRSLRGNEPKLQYQYLSLRQNGKLASFLKYFPETKHLLTHIPKVMSLVEPNKKMSKSLGQDHVIELADEPGIIEKKLKIASGINVVNTLNNFSELSKQRDLYNLIKTLAEKNHSFNQYYRSLDELFGVINDNIII